MLLHYLKLSKTKPSNAQEVGLHRARCIIMAWTLPLQDIKRAPNESFKKLTIRENGSLAFTAATIK